MPITIANVSFHKSLAENAGIQSLGGGIGAAVCVGYDYLTVWRWLYKVAAHGIVKEHTALNVFLYLAFDGVALAQPEAERQLFRA